MGRICPLSRMTLRITIGRSVRFFADLRSAYSEVGDAIGQVGDAIGDLSAMSG